MKQLIFPAFFLLLFFLPACKSNEKKKKEDFFPVLSFLKSQVAHVDTSLYEITKLTAVDSTWDTAYIKREDFRTYAKDFLDLPDLADNKYSGKYEESKFFDASLNRAIISYQPKEKNQEIQREEVAIEPGESSHDKIKTIVVDKVVGTNDSTVVKRLLWQADESFQVTTIIQKTGQPDSVQTIKIVWK